MDSKTKGMYKICDNRLINLLYKDLCDVKAVIRESTENLLIAVVIGQFHSLRVDGLL